MPIPQTKYINIISSTSGTTRVSQRELIGRVFVDNDLIPTNTVIEFGGGATIALQAIQNYFGVTSQEYAFAQKYFGFISKKGTRPQKIGFARWTSVNALATLVGATNLSLSALQAITNGQLSFSVDGTEHAYTDINLSTATSFEDVATIIGEKTGGDSIGCEYMADKGRFLITAQAGDASITIATATDLSNALGMANAIESYASPKETPVEAVSGLESTSNNFFSFAFLGTVGQNDIVALAQWTHNQNVRYLYSVTVSPTTAKTIQGLVADYDGVALTLDIYNDNAGFMPMAAIAAVDYTRPNASIDMMYQQFAGVQPSVDDLTTAQTYDAIKVNYYGVTQQAGQPIAFYQDGVLQGSITSMGVYANEAWLKDSLFTGLLDLRLGLDSLPASQTGVSMAMNVMSDSIELAKTNGVIQVGKTLTSTQKAAISEIAGNTTAWMDVQSNGYWLSCEVASYRDAGGTTKWKLSYTLIYAKGDSINFIDGRDILI